MSRVLIAGGGIAGLVTALTLHQIGVPCTVFEAVRQMKPKGVGLNLQPNAVRELYDLGIAGATLNGVGLPLREWALLGLNGREIYSEPRGVRAGYHWPQFSVDRGLFHMLLYRTVLRRLGPQSVQLGARVTGYRQDRRGVTALLADGRAETGCALVGADGIHSAIRAQMHPGHNSVNGGGAVMWRGVTLARPIRTGSSFVGMGAHQQRLAFFPISHPGLDGLARINWAVAMPRPESSPPPDDSWFRPVAVDSFRSHFDRWSLDWLDVAAMLGRAECAYETPLIDRDPVPTWRDGRVVLLGDAAHAMFPTGSNGASQAIIDARVLGAAMVEHGVNEWALDGYDDKLCAPVSALVLRNRSEGPFELLRLVEERCGGAFEHIDEVVPRAERDELMARHNLSSGFVVDMLNAAPPLITPGARARVA